MQSFLEPQKPGIVLAGLKEQIQSALWQYFADIEAALRGENMGVMPEKPLILSELEQMDRFHALPWPGGLDSQPYQRMLELSWVDEVLFIRSRTKQNAQSNQSPSF